MYQVNGILLSSEPQRQGFGILFLCACCSVGGLQFNDLQPCYVYVSVFF